MRHNSWPASDVVTAKKPIRAAAPAPVTIGTETLSASSSSSSLASQNTRDPHGRHYYWLTGEFVNFDKGKDTDVWALANNYVSVVPVQFDLTNYVLKSKLEKIWK